MINSENTISIFFNKPSLLIIPLLFENRNMDDVSTRKPETCFVRDKGADGVNALTLRK